MTRRIALLLVLCIATTVGAQQAIGIARSTDLSFGQVVAGSSPGTVTVSPNGARLATGGALLAGGTQVTPARFIVSGDPAKAYNILLPDSVELLGDSGGTLSVTDFTSTPSGQGQLDGMGTQTLSVGATLQVPAGQTHGTYSGTFSVLVQYQ